MSFLPYSLSYLFQILVFLSRYVIVYSSILFLRYHAGKVTNEMLSLPKTPFLAVGLLEALGAASGMAAGGNGYLQLMLFVSLNCISMISKIRLSRSVAFSFFQESFS